MRKKREIKNRKEEAYNTKAVTALAYIYMVLPFLIFAVGWFRIRFWTVAVAVVVFAAWRAWQDTPAFWCPSFTRDHVRSEEHTSELQ